MFTGTQRCFKTVTPLNPRSAFLSRFKRLSARDGATRHRQVTRNLSVGRALTNKVHGHVKPKETVDIPGLEAVTYAERLHYVPGLAKPEFPPWERDYKDPRYYTSPPAHEMPLFKEKPRYVFNQRTSVLEGVRQAAWLTKTKVIPGLPPHLLTLAEAPENCMADEDERVQNAIKHARFWDTTMERPGKDRYGNTLLLNLLHLCASLQSSHPALGRRIFAENYSLAATWKRGEDLFQVRGQSGLLQNSMDPLPKVSGKEEVANTSDHVLETFYPVSPTIGLQKINLYKEEVNCTGFRNDYPYPHAHTLYFLESGDPRCKLHPEQFRAKMLMFTFGNALARAHKLYGTQAQSVLDQPITVQSVGTNGRIFQFLVFQLNTTDLSGDDGIKNQMWLDEDVELYDFAKVRPLIKKKQIKVPSGLAGYKPETFKKFLALYLHGAVNDYPYPHAHTLYFLESGDPRCKLHPEQFRAKMLMFTFGNALARAHKLYGTQAQSVLDQPITVQSVGTNGRIFQFLVFQLNTTDLSGDDGIKNQMWLDEDVELYDFAKVRPLIKKKQIKVPSGLAGYKPETFKKFLALYLHGAV